MNLLEKFGQITTFVFDVDGVMTDGTLLIHEDGQFIRRMHIKDGYALQLAVKKGFNILVISGSNSDAVVTRLNGLGIRDVFMKEENKLGRLNEYVSARKLKWEEVLFMGDDIPDYPAMKQVGLACCPVDAVAEIKSISNYISPIAGGQGCVRDVIEKVLKMRNAWDLNSDIPSR
ncbi:MAG: HAD hydrolase family protein [Chitinophagaceae bacterium]|nr:HAD hydrolase family protein [Chitinophagaceae bacterium]